MRCTLSLDRIKILTAIEVVFSRVSTEFISIPLAEMEINVLIIIACAEESLKEFLRFLIIWTVVYKLQIQRCKNMLVKGQLQHFHKLSLFDRFRYVENGLDINF